MNVLGIGICSSFFWGFAQRESWIGVAEVVHEHVDAGAPTHHTYDVVEHAFVSLASEQDDEELDLVHNGSANGEEIEAESVWDHHVDEAKEVAEDSGKAVAGLEVRNFQCDPLVNCAEAKRWVTIAQVVETCADTGVPTEQIHLEIVHAFRYLACDQEHPERNECHHG